MEGWGFWERIKGLRIFWKALGLFKGDFLTEMKPLSQIIYWDNSRCGATSKQEGLKGKGLCFVLLKRVTGVKSSSESY